MNDGIIIGLAAIADYCGVTTDRLRAWVEEHPDFPARRDGKNGAWISTGRALVRWLDAYVSDPSTKVSAPLTNPRRRGGVKQRRRRAKSAAG